MLVVKEICDRVAVMENGRVVEKNDIVPLFMNPVQEITKNFLDTANNSSKIYELVDQKHPLVHLQDNQQLVRLTYGGNTVDEALISKLSRDYNVDCSIVFGNVEVIKDSPIGSLVIKFTGKEDDINQALAKTRQQGVEAEVIKRGHFE
jgi:D-methionine transport system ATP-binding protein